MKTKLLLLSLLTTGCVQATTFFKAVDTNGLLTIDAPSQSSFTALLQNTATDLTTLGDVTNSYVTLIGNDYGSAKLTYFGASPEYRGGATGVRMVRMDGSWLVEDIGTGFTATNSSTSYFPPITNWCVVGTGIATNLNIKFFSGTDALQQAQIDEITPLLPLEPSTTFAYSSGASTTTTTANVWYFLRGSFTNVFVTNITAGADGIRILQDDKLYVDFRTSGQVDATCLIGIGIATNAQFDANGLMTNGGIPEGASSIAQGDTTLAANGLVGLSSRWMGFAPSGTTYSLVIKTDKAGTVYSNYSASAGIFSIAEPGITRLPIVQTTGTNTLMVMSQASASTQLAKIDGSNITNPAAFRTAIGAAENITRFGSVFLNTGTWSPLPTGVRQAVPKLTTSGSLVRYGIQRNDTNLIFSCIFGATSQTNASARLTLAINSIQPDGSNVYTQINYDNIDITNVNYKFTTNAVISSSYATNINNDFYISINNPSSTNLAFTTNSVFIESARIQSK